VDAWRQALFDAGDPAFPVPWRLGDWPAGFGNNDISSTTTAPSMHVAMNEAVPPDAWCVRPASMPHQ
jgi:hypothetical protein